MDIDTLDALIRKAKVQQRRAITHGPDVEWNLESHDLGLIIRWLRRVRDDEALRQKFEELERRSNAQ